MKVANEERWAKLTSQITNKTRRKQFDELVQYLRDHSSYFVAPASPGYHCSWPEGLLEHSMNVAENALKLNKALEANLDEEELIICGLFHDLGKAYIEEDQPYYLIKQASDSQQKYGYVAYPPYEYNNAGQVFMTVPQRAVRVVTQFIDISDAAYQSILIHDGMYVDENKPYGCKECSMALILHMADSWAGFTMEGSVGKAEDGKSYIKNPPKDWYGKHGKEIRENRCK